MAELRKTTIKIHEDTYETIVDIANKTDRNVSEVIRELIDKGLNERVLENNTDLIAKIVREQMEIVLKPSIERLAALSSKTGHMATTSTYLLAQTLMDLVPNENRKDVKVLYDIARTKAVKYMKSKVSDQEEHVLEGELNE